MSNVLLYAGLIWVVSFAITTRWMCIYAGGFSPIWQKLRSHDRGLLRCCLAMAVGTSVIFLVSPILLPVCFATGYWAARANNKQMDSLLNNHRELLLAPIEAADLPEDIRQGFDDIEADVAPLGYTTLGDFIMKENPPGYFGRIMMPGDGQVICGIVSMFGDLNYAFTTLFSDGRLLETCSNEPTPSLCWTMGHDRTRAFMVSWQPVELAEEIHRRQVEKFALEVGDAPLAFQPDQFADVMEYEHRLFSEVNYERGELASPPPKAVLPEGTRVEIAEPVLA